MSGFQVCEMEQQPSYLITTGDDASRLVGIVAYINISFGGSTKWIGHVFHASRDHEVFEECAAPSLNAASELFHKVHDKPDGRPPEETNTKAYLERRY